MTDKIILQAENAKLNRFIETMRITVEQLSVEIDTLEDNRIARRKKTKAGFAFKDGVINGLKRRMKFHEGTTIYANMKFQEGFIEQQGKAIDDLIRENKRLEKIESMYASVTPDYDGSEVK